MCLLHLTLNANAKEINCPSPEIPFNYSLFFLEPRCFSLTRYITFLKFKLFKKEAVNILILPVRIRLLSSLIHEHKMSFRGNI
jgi:hypothetical protein